MIGKFEILGELGRGGMGVVYRAWQQDLRRYVAVKVLPQTADESCRARFVREAQAAAALSHPNILKVFEVGEHDGCAYIATEFIDGAPLDELIREGMDFKLIARIMSVVARALDYAHQHGVIHRDVKPSNILVDRDLRAVVADFGIARMVHSDHALTLTGEVIGTPSYMAPELTTGKPDAATPVSDVYSLGATLYECLAGRPPFVGSDPVVLLERVRRRDPVRPRRFNPAIPRDLEVICLKAMEKEPHRRYPSAGAMADDLDRFLCNEPIRARPPSVGYRLRMTLRRRPGLAVALIGSALAAIAAVVLGVVYLNLQVRQEEAIRGLNLAQHFLVEAEQEMRRPEPDVGRIRARLSEAKKKLEDSLARWPMAAACQALARIKRWERRYDEAIAFCSRGLEVDAADPGCLLERASIRLERASFRLYGVAMSPAPDEELAQKDLEALSGSSLTDDQQRLRRQCDGLLQLYRGEIDRAIETFTAAYQATRDEDLLLLLGMAYLNSAVRARNPSRFEQAEQALRQAIAQKPGSVMAHLNFGLVSYYRGETDEAEQRFSRALRLDPNNPVALVFRGDVRVRRGEYAGALEDLNAGLDELPNFVWGRYKRAVCHLHYKETERALSDLDHALKVDPTFLAGQELRLKLLAELGRRDRVKAALEECVRYWPDRRSHFEQLIERAREY